MACIMPWARVQPHLALLEAFRAAALYVVGSLGPTRLQSRPQGHASRGEAATIQKDTALRRRIYGVFITKEKKYGKKFDGSRM
ncbi:hypothetical protein BRADI_4g20184v3 [Brachypodium distachyon]|uniref:Uncharacterized protein n=1 Tax=Brachypodium distachyon TaxID=15368 RepID=A0A2K2CNU4_BRADI|nr:hypothetical protein BRADI_4g20184v3 [Brachypodium distachyon]